MEPNKVIDKCTMQTLLLLVLLMLPLLREAHAADAPTNGRAIHVIGSVNADIFVPVEKFPEDGETILANDLDSTGMLQRGREVFLPGGKGANSAVSAALLSAKTFFTGRFGSDSNGRMLLDELQARLVDTSNCKVVPGW